ncbi:MAG TPA: histidine phosphatase family protein, partial [Ilumatobacter sp.]|nr:histidine phosphatase family protein [Ilumatobacter sp.]
MSRAQLLVIRHGETEWSRVWKHTGRTDIPLTDVGRDEARAAARTLEGWHLAGAYCSPLERARETAELVAPACGISIDDDLVEWDYGDA